MIWGPAAWINKKQDFVLLFVGAEGEIHFPSKPKFSIYFFFIAGMAPIISPTTRDITVFSTAI